MHVLAGGCAVSLPLVPLPMMVFALPCPNCPRYDRFSAVQAARVTVVVRVRPPENGGNGNAGHHDIAVFPAVGGHDTIVVDRDGSEARFVCVLLRSAVKGHYQVRSAADSLCAQRKFLDHFREGGLVVAGFM